MDLEHAKRIGYHFQHLAPRPDPESHLPWAFAHALTPFPDPLEEVAVHLVEGELEAYWLAEASDTPLVFRVRGEISANDQEPNWPFTDTKVESRPLLPDKWTIAVHASYDRSGRRDGYKNKWEFRHLDGFSVAVESEREWDGGDEWIADDQEKFAHLLAARLGWAPSSS